MNETGDSRPSAGLPPTHALLILIRYGTVCLEALELALAQTEAFEIANRVDNLSFALEFTVVEALGLGFADPAVAQNGVVTPEAKGADDKHCQ